jgi:hypothetical protein
MVLVRHLQTKGRDMNLATLLGLDSKMLDAVQEALPVFTKAFIEHTEAMREHTEALRLMVAIYEDRNRK